MKQGSLMFGILVLAVSALYVPSAWAANEPDCGSGDNSNTIATNAKIPDGVKIPCDSHIWIGDKSEFGVYKPEAIVDAARETFIEPGCYIGANVRAGAGTQFGEDCRVEDGVKIGKDVTISHDAHLLGRSEIGNGVSVGAHVIIPTKMKVGGDILIPAWTCMTEGCLGTTNINDHVFIDEKSAYILMGFVMNIESRDPITPTSHLPTGMSEGHGDTTEINPNEWFLSVIPPDVCGTDMAVPECTDDDGAWVEYHTGPSPDELTTFTFDVIEVNGVANGAFAFCRIFAPAEGTSTARTTTGNLLTGGRGEHTFTFDSGQNLSEGVTMQCHVEANASAESGGTF